MPFVRLESFLNNSSLFSVLLSALVLSSFTSATLSFTAEVTGFSSSLGSSPTSSFFSSAGTSFSSSAVSFSLVSSCVFSSAFFPPYLLQQNRRSITSHHFLRLSPSSLASPLFLSLHFLLSTFYLHSIISCVLERNLKK